MSPGSTVWERLRRALIAWLLVLLASACGRAPSAPLDQAMGQPATLDGWRVTVYSFSMLPADEWRKPAPGSSFCAVELTLENVSEQIRYMMPERQMVLVDAQGKRYSLHHPAGVVAAREWGWTVPEGQLDPGVSVHGAVCYELPSDARDVRFVFRSSLWPWSNEVRFLLGECFSQS